MKEVETFITLGACYVRGSIDEQSAGWGHG